MKNLSEKINEWLISNDQIKGEPPLPVSEKLESRHEDSIPNVYDFISRVDFNGVENLKELTGMTTYECLDLIIKNQFLAAFNSAFFDGFEEKVGDGHLAQIVDYINSLNVNK